MEDVLLADLAHPLGERPVGRDELAARVEQTRADELGDRVDEPGAAQADRLDVADHGQLDLAAADLDALDRALGGAHPAADLRRLERGPCGRGARERLGGGAEHDLRVRADVDEEAHAPVERQPGREDPRDDVRARRRRRGPGRGRPARADGRRRRSPTACACGSVCAAIVNGAIESGSGSIPSAIWIIVTLPATTIS